MIYMITSLNVSSLHVFYYIMHVSENVPHIDYTKYNVSASKGKQLIRPRMLLGLSPDISLEDPIRHYSKARDLLLSKNRYITRETKLTMYLYFLSSS